MGGLKSPLTIFIMKKRYIILIIIVSCLWAIWRSNYFAANFRTETFYKPIFSQDFDVMKEGSTINTLLKPSFHVRHGFFLVFPCTNWFSTTDNLDGQIKYSFLSNGEIIETKTMDIPARLMAGYNGKKCDVVLFTFDLPYKRVTGPISLKVTLLSPITKLAQYRDVIRCEVAPAYWPK